MEWINEIRGGHPRVRGGNHTRPIDMTATAGPSPRTRGKRCRSAPLRRCGGAIPAYAGETRHIARTCTSPWGHPRVRGGNRYVFVDHASGAGPSPRTRGKHRLGPRHAHGPGAIPAYAGETSQHRPATRSPRAIPAYAGETPKARHSDVRMGGHPRVRGGNIRFLELTRDGKGPSPRTRGKLKYPDE